MKKLLLVTLVAACGGGSGSGIDSGKKISALSVAEFNEECNYAYDTYPPVTITCPDGSTTKKGETGNRATACAATANTVPAGCTATVGDAENCLADLYAEPDATLCSSSPTIPPSCAPLFATACQSTGREAPIENAALAVHARLGY